LREAVIDILTSGHVYGHDGRLTFTRLHSKLAGHPDRPRLVLALLDLIRDREVLVAERCDGHTLGEPVQVLIAPPT
jgi:hypothetical protein